MTKLAEVKKKLRELRPLLKERFKVKSVGIFGSYLRKEQRKGSDLDILVEFYEPIGLFDFIGLEDFLSKNLKVKVDLVMKEAIKPRVRERMVKEAIYI